MDFISDAINSSKEGDFLHGTPLPPSDIMDDILKVLDCFMEWYLLVREPSLSISQLETLSDMGVNLMNMLKEVFPDRNGRSPDVAWKLQKFHGILHVVYFIILFGWS